ncbi:uncharacterized protein Z519_02706 [Cladophialophora bantiana CBS 173.52]|uniref:Uncharacterized protein n=1 Tax=Cladophialophora bantiana (strain ATCC 10958 / CBS 173.52 / CDC B-1940 / NIH 8579) TaxID=1442370 RepID=A0A0D2IKG6_CLAB1|nr:uncharacterized protein Z519_02706 [Cladophialophora bantiana CBS 173.52]KIW97314.1 hypothetical protein Z519_02706 [Cladophialophora bantiana CBS 173.52]
MDPVKADDDISLPELIGLASKPSRQQDVGRDRSAIQYASASSHDKQGLFLHLPVDSNANHAHTGHHVSGCPSRLGECLTLARKPAVDMVEIRLRCSRHRYTIRRPRALQFSYRSQVVHAGDERGVPEPSNRSSISSHLPEDIAKERERLDLFIDLIWVGIIGNLSEVFSSLGFRPEDPDLGIATTLITNALILGAYISSSSWSSCHPGASGMRCASSSTTPTWTTWCSEHSPCGSCCSRCSNYGNQLAYLTEDIDEVKQWVISTYLIIFGAFALVELVYSIFIKWLRKLVFFQTIFRLPSVALWVTAIKVPGARAIGPVFGAIIWEYLCPIIMDSQLTEKLTPMEFKKALDVQHFQSHMSFFFFFFFFFFFSEGVLQLVKDGPLGLGLNGSTGIMVWILLIYYEFSFLYFKRDGSRRFIPAATNKGRKTLTWVFWHIPRSSPRS